MFLSFSGVTDPCVFFVRVMTSGCRGPDEGHDSRDQTAPGGTRVTKGWASSDLMRTCVGQHGWWKTLKEWGVNYYWLVVWNIFIHFLHILGLTFAYFSEGLKPATRLEMGSTLRCFNIAMENIAIYGKSPFLIVPLNIAMWNYQRDPEGTWYNYHDL